MLIIAVGMAGLIGCSTNPRQPECDDPTGERAAWGVLSLGVTELIRGIELDCPPTIHALPCREGTRSNADWPRTRHQVHQQHLPGYTPPLTPSVSACNSTLVPQPENLALAYGV